MDISWQHNCYKKIINWVKDDEFKIGFLIGQSLKQSEYILHVVELANVGIRSEHNVKKAKPTCLNDVQCNDIRSHIGQVIRMLPGGIDVQGIFVLCNKTDLSLASNETITKKFLMTIHKATSPYYARQEDCPSRRLLLHGSKKDKSIRVKTFCMSDKDFTSEELVMPDVKVTKIVDWLEINYNYSVEKIWWLPQGSDPQSLVKNEKAFLEPVKSFLKNGIILINGDICKNSDLMVGTFTDEDSIKDNIVEAEFLDNEYSNTQNARIEDSPGIVHSSGYVVGRSCLQQRATILEAKTALRTDLVRSMVSRWQMHCDSLIEEPLEGPLASVVHEPPRRVFIKDEGLPIILCDYLFPGDSVSDACQSAFEILGITVTEENIDDRMENFLDELRDKVMSVDNFKMSYPAQISLAIMACLFAFVVFNYFFPEEKTFQ